MRLIFFDTETTGLPKDWKAAMTDLDNWPRVIQLAWLVTDEAGEEISRGRHLIKPDGWIMPTETFWIENAFSQEDSILNGQPIVDILQLFLTALNNCDILVSHNMAFDYNVLGAEMIRASLRANNKPRKICTKEMGTNICRIRGPRGRYKWPKLHELHQFFFSRGFENAHDALGDVLACRDCFFEMVRRKLVMITNNQYY